MKRAFKNLLQFSHVTFLPATHHSRLPNAWVQWLFLLVPLSFRPQFLLKFCTLNSFMQLWRLLTVPSSALFLLSNVFNYLSADVTTAVKIAPGRSRLKSAHNSLLTYASEAREFIWLTTIQIQLPFSWKLLGLTALRYYASSLRPQHIVDHPRHLF